MDRLVGTGGKLSAGMADRGAYVESGDSTLIGSGGHGVGEELADGGTLPFVVIGFPGRGGQGGFCDAGSGLPPKENVVGRYLRRVFDALMGR